MLTHTVCIKSHSHPADLSILIHDESFEVRHVDAEHDEMGVGPPHPLPLVRCAGGLQRLGKVERGIEEGEKLRRGQVRAGEVPVRPPLGRAVVLNAIAGKVGVLADRATKPHHQEGKAVDVRLCASASL